MSKGKLLFFFIFLYSNCIASDTLQIQTGKNKPYVSLNYFPTVKVIRFNSYGNQPFFISYNPVCYELLINRLFTGMRQWERDFGYPNIGFSLQYLDNRSTLPLMDLGTSVHLVPFAEMDIIRKKKWVLTGLLGFGAGYHTKVYDRFTNPHNTAYSTHLTAAIMGDIRVAYLVHKYIQVQTMLSVRHYSNGAIAKPNQGSNYIMWGVGLAYHPWGCEVKKLASRSPLRDKRWRLNLETGYNRKAIRSAEFINYPDDDDPNPVWVDNSYMRYTIFHLGMYISRKVSNINALLMGLDAYWDESMYDEMRIKNGDYFYLNKPPQRPRNTVPNYYFIANIGTEIFLGNVSYTPQFGFYLYQVAYFSGRVMHRHTLKYYLTDWLYIKGALKVFTFRADSFDLGLGVRF